MRKEVENKEEKRLKTREFDNNCVRKTINECYLWPRYYGRYVEISRGAIGRSKAINNEYV